MTSEELDKLEFVVEKYWTKVQLCKKLDDTLRRSESTTTKKAKEKWHIAYIIKNFLLGTSNFDVEHDL